MGIFCLFFCWTKKIECNLLMCLSFKGFAVLSNSKGPTPNKNKSQVVSSRNNNFFIYLHVSRKRCLNKTRKFSDLIVFWLVYYYVWCFHFTSEKFLKNRNNITICCSYFSALIFYYKKVIKLQQQVPSFISSKDSFDKNSIGITYFFDEPCFQDQFSQHSNNNNNYTVGLHIIISSNSSQNSLSSESTHRRGNERNIGE